MPENNDATTAEQPAAEAAAPPRKHCGIIMPISESPEFPGHWAQVRILIERAAEKAGFTSGMVSDNAGQDMIHASIIQNIYHNEVVVCDVSSLNPNVMLELGLRMATKKPLVLVFDSADNYPFDIKNFIYAEYPKSLHFFRIEKFVDDLAKKIKQVYDGEQNKTYKPFLSHFSDIIIETSTLDTTSQTVVEAISKMAEDIRGIKADMDVVKPSKRTNAINLKSFIKYSTPHLSIQELSTISNAVIDRIKADAKISDENLLSQVALEFQKYFYDTHKELSLAEVNRKYSSVIPELLEVISNEIKVRREMMDRHN